MGGPNSELFPNADRARHYGVPPGPEESTSDSERPVEANGDRPVTDVSSSSSRTSVPSDFKSAGHADAQEAAGGEVHVEPDGGARRGLRRKRRPDAEGQGACQGAGQGAGQRPVAPATRPAAVVREWVGDSRVRVGSGGGLYWFCGLVV